MKLSVNQELDAASWDRFLLQHPQANLLQSWAWGEFQKSLGNTIWRFRITQNQQIVTQLLTIKLSIGFRKYIIYAPRDLLINKSAPAHQQHQAIKLIIQKIKQLAPQHNAILFRVEPPVNKTDNTAVSVYKSLGFIPSVKSLQPATNLMLNISDTETEILSQMKSKTRYNIRLATKKDVAVTISKNSDDIQIFNQLNKETTGRSGFKSHPPTYYQKQFDALKSQSLIELFIAYYKNTPLAAILVAQFGKTTTYLHGASSWRYKDKMASYALQWTAIQIAKNKGYVLYDFGGVNYNNNHPNWAGVTRFKVGFGGQMVEYIGSLELPLDRLWFRLYKLINFFK